MSKKLVGNDLWNAPDIEKRNADVIRLYESDRLSLEKIGNIYAASYKSIRRILVENKIPIRQGAVSESKTLAPQQRIEAEKRIASGHKTCRLCGKLLPFSDFNKSKINLDRRQSQCKNCVHNAKMLRKHNMTLAEYNVMLQNQNNGCAICECTAEHPNNIGNRWLCIDHCHKTNKVRGLLCNIHNLLLGHANDDPIILRKTADYAEKHRLLHAISQPLTLSLLFSTSLHDRTARSALTSH
jgi:predicted HTH domain antitoxin